jgi:hypothetical protein
VHLRRALDAVWGFDQVLEVKPAQPVDELGAVGARDATTLGLDRDLTRGSRNECLGREEWLDDRDPTRGEVSAQTGQRLAQPR